MKVLCFIIFCLSVLALFRCCESKAGTASGMNGTLVLKQTRPDNEEEPLTRKNVPDDRRSFGRNRQRGWSQDRVADVVKAVVKNNEQVRDSLRLSCNKDQYYDFSTQNCEDCKNLCYKFSPKMCQVYCPGLSLALDYKLLQLASDSASWNKANQLQDQKITEIKSRIELIEDELESAQEHNADESQDMEKKAKNETYEVLSIVAISISGTVLACIIIIAVLMVCKRDKRNRCLCKENDSYKKELGLGVNSSEEDMTKELTKETNCAYSNVEVDPHQVEPSTTKFSPNNFPPSEDRSEETNVLVTHPEQR